jgi:hypothetical protein
MELKRDGDDEMVNLKHCEAGYYGQTKVFKCY